MRSTRALRGDDGKVSGTTAKVRQVGRAVRGFGGRLTEGGAGAAAALSSLARLFPAAGKQEASGLGLLDPPEDSEPGLPEPPLRPHHKPAEPDRPDRPSSPEAPRPALPRIPSERRSERPAETTKPETPNEPPAAAAPKQDREARFKGLPELFIPEAAATDARPHPEALRVLILDICRERDWTTPGELARWFDMHRRSLSNRYIRPLVEAGLLERRYPDRPNSPKQAYRTRRDTAPPHPGTVPPAAAKS